MSAVTDALAANVEHLRKAIANHNKACVEACAAVKASGDCSRPKGQFCSDDCPLCLTMDDGE